MGRLANLYRTSVGKKWIMAVTGLVLLLFVLGHMLGNLKLYLGQESLDHYGEFLRTAGEPLLPRGVALWIARLGLLACAVLHIWMAVVLTRQSLEARPIPYTKNERLAFSYASYTMRWGGVVILLFVLYHLMHLTWGNMHPDFHEGLIYHNVTVGLARPLAGLIYIVANVLLGFHIYHGLWSSFQTLGINNPRYNAWRRPLALAVAVIIAVGNVSMPLAVMTGIVKQPPAKAAPVAQATAE
jgi:succinate dehydrogenase / fumarate reductase cytochrome b subunit